MVESYGRIDMFIFLSGGGKFCFQGNWFIMINTSGRNGGYDG